MMDESSIEERISKLEKIHENFRIVGGSNVTVEGSLKHGFAICSTCPGEDQGTGGAINIPPAVYGACCFDDGSCSVTTQIACTSAMGTYQGDGTDCDPNPCPQPTGACCHGTDCDIETEEDCTGSGGTYQGDDTTCDPNPCETTPPCDFDCGGFFNPDDGLYYNKRIYTNTPIDDCPPEGGCCISFTGGASCCDPWMGNQWYFRDVCPDVQFLTEEHYDSECNLVQSFEGVSIQKYINAVCRDENGTAVPDCSGFCPCEEPDHPAFGGPCDPPYWTSCTHEEPCIP